MGDRMYFYIMCLIFFINLIIFLYYLVNIRMFKATKKTRRHIKEVTKDISVPYFTNRIILNLAVSAFFLLVISILVM